MSQQNSSNKVIRFWDHSYIGIITIHKGSREKEAKNHEKKQPNYIKSTIVDSEL